MIYFSDGSRVGEYMLCHGETTAADNKDLTITCEDTTDLLTATLYGVIVSIDDIDAQTVTYSARIAIEKAAKPAFDMTVTSATITNLGNGKLHAAVNVDFDGSNLVGTFNAANVVLNGQCFTKAAIYENGDESGIAMTAFSNVAGTISAFTFDRTNAVIEFDITPANASEVYKYGSTTVTFELTWTDAYTDTTSLSSGSVSGSPIFAGGYINGQYPDFSITVQSVNITRPTLGKVHAVATLGFAGSGLKGSFSVSGVTVGGTVLTKANVFAAGGESGATATTINNVACTASNITQNLSLGTVEFDITPSNVADIQKFNSVTFNATITFANAWTNNTLKKSGSANGAGTWSGGYLQPEMDMSTANTFAVVLPTDSGYDETEISIESGYITEEIASAMQTLLDRTGIQMAFPLPTGTCNALQDGVTPISSAYTLSFDKAEVTQGDSGKFIFVGLAMSVGSFADVEEWTMVNITQTPTTAYLYTDAAHTVRAGLYNASKRWTPLPGANIPSVVNP